MRKMDVTIIIPVYNVAPYIEDCIKSVIHQTYLGSIECLIIDDCGTDDSMALVERLIASYNGPIAFRILRHDHNRGLSAARNTGTLQATGNYLYYLDSDDEITENCIEVLMKRANENPLLEMVQGNTLKWHSKKSRSSIQLKKIHHPYAATNTEVRKCFYNYQQMMFGVWNKLIRRDFVINNNLLCQKGIISEDYLWSFNLLKYLNCAYFESTITYHYRIRPNSIVFSSSRKIKAHSFKTIYHTILTHLTPMSEREELDFFSAKIGYAYVRYVKMEPEYNNIILLCRKLSKQNGCGMSSVAYSFFRTLGRFKNGWIILALFDRLKKPSIILRDICRLENSVVAKQG